MAKEHSPDQMAMGWFILTIVGAALYIGTVFLFVL
jgi:hypothetical protein